MIVDDLKSILESDGYTVNTQVQEKMLKQNEVTILIEDIEVDVESFDTYNFTYLISILFMTQSPSTMVSEIKNIISLIENNINTTNKYRFVDVQIVREGTLYMVGVLFEFTEVI